MVKLKITYSHEKEQKVAKKFTDRLVKMGRPVPDLTEPAFAASFVNTTETTVPLPSENF